MLTTLAFAPDYLTLRAARILLKTAGFTVVKRSNYCSGKSISPLPATIDFLLIGLDFSATGQVINATMIDHLLETVYPEIPAILWSPYNWEKTGSTCRWRPLTVGLDALASPDLLTKTVHALMHQAAMPLHGIPT